MIFETQNYYYDGEILSTYFMDPSEESDNENDSVIRAERTENGT